VQTPPRFWASRILSQAQAAPALGRPAATRGAGARDRAHPQVLFDEPLSNLDAKLRVQMRVELKKLHERLGTTAI